MIAYIFSDPQRLASAKLTIIEAMSTLILRCTYASRIKREVRKGRSPRSKVSSLKRGIYLIVGENRVDLFIPSYENISTVTI